MKNRNKYFAAAFTLIFVSAAAITIGVTTLTDNSYEQNSAYEQQASVDNPTSLVDANKNAPTKTEEKTPSDEKTGTEKINSDTVSKDAGNPPEENKTTTPSVEETPSSSSESSTTSSVWPLDTEGEILMEYSPEVAIFDSTLEQYRTNDNICIQANEGDKVKSCFAGKVEYVGYDPVNGYTVTLSHSNGYTTTYSQLSEDVAVEEGQSVKMGTTLGYVAAPTIYSSTLGPHLALTVEYEGSTVDPQLALAE